VNFGTQAPASSPPQQKSWERGKKRTGGSQGDSETSLFPPHFFFFESKKKKEGAKTQHKEPGRITISQELRGRGGEKDERKSWNVR